MEYIKEIIADIKYSCNKIYENDFIKQLIIIFITVIITNNRESISSFSQSTLGLMLLGLVAGFILGSLAKNRPKR